MKNRFTFSICFAIVLVSFLSKPDFAVEIVPATAQDILDALGPDSKGLTLSKESLPDLFTLTASRIEENAKQFTIEQPYQSGRWKGGKVVIEYARDLSYTLVSVYDKTGHRERIYSVRTNYSEHIARQVARTQAPPVEAEPPSEPAVQETFHETPAPPRSAPPPARPATAATATNNATGSSGGESNGGYEWDESKGTYVAVAPSVPVFPAETAVAKPVEPVSEPAPASRSSKRKRRHSETVTVASVPKVRHASTSDNAPSDVTPPASSDGGVWIPPTTKSHATGTKVQVADTVWVEKRPGNTADHSTDEAPPKKTRRRKHTSSNATASTPASPPANDEWVPKSIQDNQPPVKKGEKVEVAQRPTEDKVPSTEELLAGPVEPPTDQAPPPPTEKPSRKRRRTTSTAEAAPVTPPARTASAPEPEAAPAPVREKTRATQAPPPEPIPVVAEEAPAPVPVTKEAAPPGPTGPDTSGSDAWTPKATPKHAAEPEPTATQEPVKVAMIPKQAPVDNSVDNLLKMANEGKEGAPHESDTWVPSKTAAAKPDVDLNKELVRIRAQEKKQAAVAKPVVKVRSDVNNPEEGVLPVSTFEKFSGPMYGRHREYERRFYPGKRAKKGSLDHDFYVEEVDRKKEIHNVYYYKHQKGKPPKLVAVERHDKVSFMGNYDIDKEDNGKTSTF